MSAGRTLRIGTRGSALALWQARRIETLLARARPGQATQIVKIATTGDIVLDVPLSQVEGKAFFTKELDDALLDERIDLAVHSLKDVATRLPAGLALAAVPEREDPRDALVSRNGVSQLADLPRGARIATSSVRRRAFLRRLRPDCEVVDLRGNVPTRMRLLDEGRFDAIVVAAAGLHRLELGGRIAAYLDTEAFPPAAAQGALGVCARAADAEVTALLATLDERQARIETSAERAFLQQLEAGCQVPAGVLAKVSGSRVSLYGARCHLDGSAWVSARREVSIDEADRGGIELAVALVDAQVHA